MRRKRGTGAVTATVCVALLAVLVGSAASASPGQRKPDLLVGANVSLTGPFAFAGVPTKNGIVLAAKQINAKGGIGGRKIALRILDDASSPTQAVSNHQRLISDGALAILGPITGGTTAPTTAVTVRENILQIAGSGSDVPGTAHGRTVFHIPAPTTLYGNAVGCYVTKTLKSKRVAILYSTDAIGLSTDTSLRAFLERNNISVVSNEAVDLTSPDATVQLTKIREQRPDVLVNMVTGGPGGTAMRVARQLGITAPFVGHLGISSAAVFRLAGGAANNAIVADLASSTDPLPGQTTFVRTYTRNFGILPERNSFYGFDMMSLTAAAIRGTKKADPKQSDGLAFARVLERTKVDGVLATYRYRPFKPAYKNDEHGGVRQSGISFYRVRGESLTRLPAKQQVKC